MRDQVEIMPRLRQLKASMISLPPWRAALPLIILLASLIGLHWLIRRYHGEPLTVILGPLAAWTAPALLAMAGVPIVAPANRPINPGKFQILWTAASIAMAVVSYLFGVAIFSSIYFVTSHVAYGGDISGSVIHALIFAALSILCPLLSYALYRWANTSKLIHRINRAAFCCAILTAALGFFYFLYINRFVRWRW